MSHYDPANSLVRLQSLVSELREELAPAAKPNAKRIIEIVADIRLQASDVKVWAYHRLEKEDV